MARGTVLIADDDTAIRTVLNQALARAGYAPRATGNAATLWRWVSQGEGDVVITDVVMPDENGLDLIPRIKKLRPELRVIAMSAQNTLMTAVKAAERGVFEYLPKPFDLQRLTAVIREQLAVHHRSERQRLRQQRQQRVQPWVRATPACLLGLGLRLSGWLGEEAQRHRERHVYRQLDEQIEHAGIRRVELEDRPGDSQPDARRAKVKHGGRLFHPAQGVRALLPRARDSARRGRAAVRRARRGFALIG